MAILSGVPGLKVCIAVQGKPLMEFPYFQDPTPSHTTQYVLTRPGMNFVVVCGFHEQYSQDPVAAHLYINGCLIQARVFHDFNRIPLYGVLRGPAVRVGSEYHSQEMFFSEWQWQTAPNIADQGVSDTIASISILFYRVADISENEPPCKVAIPPVPVFSYQAVEADPISQCVSFGPPAGNAPPQKFLSCTHIDNEPFASFTFLYRSLDELIGAGFDDNGAESGGNTFDETFHNLNDGGIKAEQAD